MTDKKLQSQRELYISIANRVANYDDVWATPFVNKDNPEIKDEPAFIRAMYDTIPF